MFNVDTRTESAFKPALNDHGDIPERSVSARDLIRKSAIDDWSIASR
jgi:hypothetical protein